MSVSDRPPTDMSDVGHRAGTPGVPVRIRHTDSTTAVKGDVGIAARSVWRRAERRLVSVIESAKSRLLEPSHIQSMPSDISQLSRTLERASVAAREYLDSLDTASVAATTSLVDLRLRLGHALRDEGKTRRRSLISSFATLMVDSTEAPAGASTAGSPARAFPPRLRLIG